MMQANRHVVGRLIIQQCAQPIELVVADHTAGAAFNAAVDAGKRPVAGS